MNNLSWIIYWSAVAPKLATWLCILSFLGTIFGLVLFGLSFVAVSEGWSEVKSMETDSDYYRKVHAKGVEAANKAVTILRRLGLLAPVFFVLWGASFLVPDKESFYMIAASEMGGRAVETPEFTKVRAVVNKFLDKQLADDDNNKQDNNQSN